MAEEPNTLHGAYLTLKGIVISGEPSDDERRLQALRDVRDAVKREIVLTSKRIQRKKGRELRGDKRYGL